MLNVVLTMQVLQNVFTFGLIQNAVWSIQNVLLLVCGKILGYSNVSLLGCQILAKLMEFQFIISNTH